MKRAFLIACLFTTPAFGQSYADRFYEQNGPRDLAYELYVEQERQELEYQVQTQQMQIEQMQLEQQQMREQHDLQQIMLMNSMGR